MRQSHRSRTMGALALTAATSLALTTLGTSTSSAAGRASGTTRVVAAPAAGTDHAGGDGDARGLVDARRGTGAAAAASLRRASERAANRPATRDLRRALGSEAILDIDGTTGTPRVLERLDGYLTRASKGSAKQIALGYVAVHHNALGLSLGDLDTLRFRRDYVDVAGTHHLSWTQVVGGVEVFGNGLTASVTKSGRLLAVGGSPAPDVEAATRGARKVQTPRAALRLARKDTGDPAEPGRRDTASQVLFVTRTGTHLGWRTLTMSAAHPALSVVDADTGGVLYRRSLGNDETSDPPNAQPKASTGLAYRYFPGHKPHGGAARAVDYTRLGWLSAQATILSGNNSHTYSDVNDDNVVQRSEEVPPRTAQKWDYKLKPFNLPGVSFCNNPYPCSWDPNTPYSWRVNRAQNASQVFFFVNRWHDHLLGGPIGFTEDAGNFQVLNGTGRGLGGDPVDTETDDGANSANGLPDGSHVDNANMDTPPDGTSPRMQMYLQHQPGTTYPDGDPFAPTNVGDEADTVYHEYTHGLSNRLVVDADGASTLGNFQAGAMGEAWSDWYAMDYLVASDLQQDKLGTADVVLFQYDGDGIFLDRTEPIDCKVGSTASRCTGGATGHTGGYTYADYGTVGGGPEVHSDGEIWSQTLWDLRDELGTQRTESLVTRAMELSPSNPSYLDERNAILVADTALYGGADQSAIWRVFAHRGMGYYAGSLTADDTSPGADFHVPPGSTRTGSISGTVTDQDSGAPVEGATVTLAFQGAGRVNPTATTDAAGHYTLGPLPVGTYPKLAVTDAGYDTQSGKARVAVGGTVRDVALRRDYAASGGGAEITDFNGPDFGPSCGPPQAIDGSQGQAWSSTTGDDAGDPTNHFVPKFLVVDLHTTVDVTQFAVDPAAGCGDGGSASTGAYKIETSPNGTAWTTASSGAFTVDDRGRLNELTPTAGAEGVRYVRFTILGNQTPDFATNCPGGAYSGCSYTDLSELEVYGAPAS